MGKTIDELELELAATRKELDRERRGASEARRASEYLTGALIENYPDIILIMQPDGVVVATNDQTATRLGTTKQQLMGSVAFARMALETGMPVHYEDEHRGRIFDTVAFQLQRPEDGAPLVAVVSRDVTDSRKAEEFLRQREARHWHSEKMEALGILASGIAHDFNNALTPILVNSKLAERSGITDARRNQLLGEIQRAGDHAAALIRQILEYGRDDRADIEFIDLAATIHEVETFMRATLPAAVSISVDVPSDLAALRADPTRLRQALMNLCINAGQAMAGAGGALAISVRTERVGQGSNAGAIQELAAGEYRVISVSDTGKGIEPEIVQRIFDPFFSTKSADEGSGLGLFVVAGVARAHRGTVTVDSTNDHGSTLSLWIRAEQCSERAPEPSIPDAEKPGSLHVMLVDDEPAVLRAATGILELDGHRVSQFSGCAEALSAFELTPGVFDLAILDQQLGDGSGFDIAEKLRDVRPELAIVLCSGNVTPQHRGRCQVLGIRILTKPYTVDQLYAMVASAAQRAPEAGRRDAL